MNELFFIGVIRVCYLIMEIYLKIKPLFDVIKLLDDRVSLNKLILVLNLHTSLYDF